MREPRVGILILDERLNVVLADGQALYHLEEAAAPGQSPVDVLQRLRKCCSGAAAGDPDGSEYVIVDGLCVRLVRLVGTDGERTALFLEPIYTREALENAVARFRLSPRESDVVRFLLDGASVSEVADGLGIAQSTVGDYLKRLFAKTGVRNRTEMIAKLLGWHPAERRA